MFGVFELCLVFFVIFFVVWLLALEVFGHGYVDLALERRMDSDGSNA